MRANSLSRRGSQFLAYLVLAAMGGGFVLPNAHAGACHAQAIFQQADSLLKQRRFAAAKAELSTLEGCKDLSPQDRFTLAWLLGRSRDSQAALKIFQSVPRNVPDTATHQYAIALAHFELEEYQDAADALKDLAADGPLDAKSANLLGVSYSKLNLYQNAYQVFTEEIRRNPSDLFSYLNLITLFADAGRFSDAVGIADQGSPVFPGNADIRIARGAAYTLMGELEKAHADFATAVELSPRLAAPRFFLALSQYRQGDYESCSADLRAATKAGIVDSDLHYLLAECLLKTAPTKPALAIAELDRAIELNSKAVAARTLRGKLLLEQGKVREAMIDLEIAHRRDPASRSAAYHLARAELKAGRAQEANALFQKLQSANGDSLSELSEQKLHQALGRDTTQ